MRPGTSIVSLVALGLLATGVGSPASAESQVAKQVFTAETTKVVVDVVVREGDGRPVADLSREDFEILEDGVPQTLESFAHIQAPTPVVREAGKNEPTGESPPATSGEATVEPAMAPPAPAVIALVFDQLSTEGRLRAQRAASELLERLRRPDDVVGVFSVEGGLVVLQDFTTDGDLLEAGVEALGSRLQHVGDSYGQISQNRAAQRAQVAAAIATGLRMGHAAGARARSQAGFMAIVQSAREHFEQLQRDAQGWLTANALAAITEAMGGVDGRKAIVLFSEAPLRTHANEERFLSVVHSATRSNVVV